ncbi:MAG: hypothetical protein EHM25_06870 [Nitrosopumilales archaeon]|nr:MAG: hypothetical protein EHM25_06870 [Nitrosopumilales archaeon]
MKLDPYNSQGLYENWKKNPENTNVSQVNNKILQQYIFDMELGKNISRHTKKGARSFIRLNKARQKIYFICELLEKHYKVMDVTKITKDQVQSFFHDMRTGKIKRLDGAIYKSTGDYVKIFKAFWHWYQRVSKKVIEDITIELDTKEEPPEFVYFTEEQLNEMIIEADDDMKVLMLFLYDTGIRVTEMKNIKVNDFLNNFAELNIRQETAKTFGRRIKLMMCSETIRNYIKTMELKSEDYLFSLNAATMNQRLNKIGENVLHNKQLTLYDFRHSSACYWYPRYPNIQGLLYRFGWKDIKMAHYYARFLGMEDTITEENLLLGVTKTGLEKEIESLKRMVNQQKKNSIIQNGLIVKTFLQIESLKPEERKKALELKAGFDKLINTL